MPLLKLTRGWFSNRYFIGHIFIRIHRDNLQSLFHTCCLVESKTTFGLYSQIVWLMHFISVYYTTVFSLFDVCGLPLWYGQCEGMACRPASILLTVWTFYIKLNSTVTYIKRRQWWNTAGDYWVAFVRLANGCRINAKDPSSQDSSRWFPHSRCGDNSAHAKALRTFSRHLTAGFTELNPAPRDLLIYIYIIYIYIYTTYV